MSYPQDEMNSIWAPWRFEYFSIDKSRDFFSEAANTTDDAAHLVVARSKNTFLMLNRYPYSVGHMMAVPYRKVAEISELTDAEKIELFDLVTESQRLLRLAIKAQGFNVGFNLGTCAGAGVADHIHMHIVPRWEGDTNIMPVLGGVRVQAEPLSRLYSRIMEIKTA